MSENWQSGSGSEDPAEDTPPAPTDPGHPGAISLPAAGSDGGAILPRQGAGTELPPTGPVPPMTTGVPTPPAGGPAATHPGWSYPASGDAFGGWPSSSWAPSGWGVGAPPPPPYGSSGVGYGPGGTTPPPPYGGWPAPGYTSSSPHSPTSGRRSGLIATLATLVVVAALLVGAGLGRVVWPSGGSAASTSSGSSGAAGSGGSIENPFGGGSSGSGTSPYGGQGSSGNSSTGAGAPSDISAIAAKVDPALVDINTNLSYEDEQAAGTGMVLTSDGLILTNNHVIDGATSISVTDVGNGKTYNANVVGYDRTGDVAVIKLVGASGLQTVSIASGTTSVGEAVVGIGNAGGAGGTPSTAGGSITALNQSITASDENGGNSETLDGLIETNAGIEPGDSGGSLVNANSQVIGMDTAASTGYETSGTQAYAIPIGTALSIAKQIEAGQGSSTIHIGATGFLGVSVGESSSSSSGGDGGGFGGLGGLGLGGNGSSGNGSSASGAVVEGTLSGSPAAQAGLVQGDVITGLNGHTITSSSDLSNDLVPEHPGDQVQLQWVNTSGQTQTATVTLTSGPPS